MARTSYNPPIRSLSGKATPVERLVHGEDNILLPKRKANLTQAIPTKRHLRLPGDKNRLPLNFSHNHSPIYH